VKKREGEREGERKGKKKEEKEKEEGEGSKGGNFSCRRNLEVCEN
jgi:hypothetical protein